MPKENVTFNEVITDEINRVEHLHEKLIQTLCRRGGVYGFDDLTQAIRDYKIEIRTLQGVLSLHEELNQDA